MPFQCWQCYCLPVYANRMELRGFDQYDGKVLSIFLFEKS